MSVSICGDTICNNDLVRKLSSLPVYSLVPQCLAMKSAGSPGRTGLGPVAWLSYSALSGRHCMTFFSCNNPCQLFSCWRFCWHVLQVKHYSSLIKHPMDFTTIKSKLRRQHFNHYDSVKDFVKDVRLVFSNCVAFNGVSGWSQLWEVGRFSPSPTVNILLKS